MILASFLEATNACEPVRADSPVYGAVTEDPLVSSVVEDLEVTGPSEVATGTFYTALAFNFCIFSLIAFFLFYFSRF